MELTWVSFFEFEFLGDHMLVRRQDSCSECTQIWLESRHQTNREYLAQPFDITQGGLHLIRLRERIQIPDSESSYIKVESHCLDLAMVRAWSCLTLPSECPPNP